MSAARPAFAGIADPDFWRWIEACRDETDARAHLAGLTWREIDEQRSAAARITGQIAAHAILAGLASGHPFQPTGQH